MIESCFTATNRGKQTWLQVELWQGQCIRAAAIRLLGQIRFLWEQTLLLIEYDRLRIRVFSPNWLLRILRDLTLWTMPSRLPERRSGDHIGFLASATAFDAYVRVNVEKKDQLLLGA